MLIVAVLGAMSGCAEHHLCEPEERCNLRDDDCDGLVDEGFVDEDGVYLTVEHCGTCGIDCAAAFPTAEETACEVDPTAGPVCVLVSCPDGFHRAGDGSCAPDVPVLCLPCEADEDCALRLPGTRCLETGSGQSRCGQPCDGGRLSCPEGFSCADGQCAPDSGWCGCSAETEGAEIACLLRVDDAGHACVGVQRCGPDGPGPCEPALGEACNTQDDDCDGAVDEDYRDDAGRYVDRLHCGGCAIPCVEPGPNMEALCLPDGAGVRCEVDCLEGFVDVDGILANGCECERFDGMGPPPVVGGDADCDGVPDDTDDFIYVTTSGSDTNPGTLARPMRTLAASLARGLSTGKSVLVSRGIYEGPLDVVGGVSIFGGYSVDFRDRDLGLYPVVVEPPSPGAPALTCDGVRAPTAVEGFTIEGTDASAPGAGSTAAFLDGCGPEVRFAALTIFAGRGSDGADGADSSARLSEWGFSSLEELNGAPGADGRAGTTLGDVCRVSEGGAGGAQSCRGVDVSGGDGGAAACPETGCVNGSACGNGGCTDYTVGGVCDFAAVLRDAVPNPPAEAGRGPMAGAAGALTYNAPTNRGTCNFCDDNPSLQRHNAHGGDGAEGSDGTGGRGCMAAAVLDPGTGRVSGGGGAPGMPGRDGSGGGGAGAGAGYEVIGGTTNCFSPTGSDHSGGSGGGGGSGGCGAPGAAAGAGGGASVGLVVRLPSGVASGPTFDEVRVVTASGGRGGDGGVGADGGFGGAGGAGGIGHHWCARRGGRGGDGGRGGAGGGAGGGCGGGAYGVYLVPRGADPTSYRDTLAMDLTIQEAGVAGRGGRGGFSPGASGTDGSDGTEATVFVAP